MSAIAGTAVSTQNEFIQFIKKPTTSADDVREALTGDGITVDGFDSDNYDNPLTASFYREDPSIAELLIKEFGAKVNEKLPNTEYPIFRAIYAKHDKTADFVTLLLDNGADAKQKLEWGLTPLHRAARLDSDKGLAVVEVLLSREPSLVQEKTTDQYQKTPLHFAAQKGNLLVTQRLLQSVGDLTGETFQDSSGVTPLFSAVIAGRSSRPVVVSKAVEVATALIDAGFSVDDTNGEEKTPLHLAAEFKLEEMATMLLQKGARADSQDGYGMTSRYRMLANGMVKPLAISLFPREDEIRASARGILFFSIGCAAVALQQRYSRCLSESQEPVEEPTFMGSLFGSAETPPTFDECFYDYS